jgi:Na+/H+ antiporter NhaD/arsenite permease-like protein
MGRTVLNFIKKEIVLCVAGVLAIATAFVVHPSKAYMDYIDFKVLALLFALMLVVAGLRQMGVFTAIIRKLVAKVHTTRVIELILVFMPFFAGMVITNDVALITFVPFAIELLQMIGRSRDIVYIVVLQTIAANLGSMATPIGNPQNIFLFTAFDMNMGDFLGTMMPYVVLAMLILAVCVCVLKSETISVSEGTDEEINITGWKLGVLIGVFAICIACVARVLDYRVMLAIAIVGILLVDAKLFLKADYILLITFVAFFIMIGNIRSIPEISSRLSEIVQGREIAAGILSSQVISNVPAAVLLSSFTDNGRELLAGVNIGGLGTIIASMASLISFRIYGGMEGAAKGKFMGVFTALNLLFLIFMVIMAVVITVFL